MNIEAIEKNIREVSSGFSEQRSVRQRRRELEETDFARLREAGFPLVGVPIDQGGVWQDVQSSTRPVCDILRTLAHGDSSVALVCAMHPAVLSFWLASPRSEPSKEEAWAKQRRDIFQTAKEGAFWGTVTSEPGSGGDIAKTRAVARPTRREGRYLLSGQKAFGSGSGITSYVITTAIPEGEESPELFYVDMRDVSWCGSDGVVLTAPWDGHGMTATQSHALRFEGRVGARNAWPGSLTTLAQAANPFIACTFTAVIVGIVETAVSTAKKRIAEKREDLRPYERVQWTKAEMEGWLVLQAYEGILRAIEDDDSSLWRATQGKMVVAELAESALNRICRVLGGGTFSRTSPYGFWCQDVRALGFLRPPWGLAYDHLFEWSCDDGVTT